MNTTEKQYMIRVTDGSERPESYGGFTWNRVGEWTEAPDWNPDPMCGGGLHGQHPEAGGYRHRGGTVPELLEIEGPVVKIGGDKVKVRRAKRIAVGNLNMPEMPRRWDALSLSDCTGLRELPMGLAANWLNLARCTGLRDLPEGLSAEEIDLSDCTALRELPTGLSAETLDLYGCTGLRELPADLECYYLDLNGCTGLRELPATLMAMKLLDLTGCTGIRELPEGLKVKKIYGWDHKRQRAIDILGC